MKIIKLNSWWKEGWEEAKRKEVYVNTECIQSFRPERCFGNSQTELVLNRSIYHIEESCEEILKLIEDEN